MSASAYARRRSTVRTPAKCPNGKRTPAKYYARPLSAARVCARWPKRAGSAQCPSLPDDKRAPSRVRAQHCVQMIGSSLRVRTRSKLYPPLPSGKRALSRAQRCIHAKKMTRAAQRCVCCQTRSAACARSALHPRLPNQKSGTHGSIRTRDCFLVWYY